MTRYHDVDSGTQNASYDVSGTTTTIAAQSFSAANGHHYDDRAAEHDVADLRDRRSVRQGPAVRQGARAQLQRVAERAERGRVVVPPGTDITTQSPTLAGTAYQNAVPASTQDSIYLNGGSYQVIVTTAGSKTPILKTAPVTINNNADWLLLTIPSGGVGDVTPNDIHVLVAQGNDADASARNWVQ